MSSQPFSLSIKRRIIGFGLLAVGLLAGCSAVKLGYGQGPMLAHWWLDGHVDFDSAQSQRVKDELRRWFAWHQQSELTRYAAHLAQVRNESQQPLTPQRLCRFSEETRDLLVPALERSLPAAAGIVLSLTPAQLDRIDARYQERTQKMRDEMLLPDPQKRHQASVERVVKRYEGFYGRLSAEQRQMIDTSLQAAPANPELMLERRQKRHTQMMNELRAIAQDRPPAAQVQQRLGQLLRRFDGRSPVEPAEQAQAIAQGNCELAARIHNSASATQRQALAEKLKGWQMDLNSLATGPAGPPSAAVGAVEAPTTVTR